MSRELIIGYEETGQGDDALALGRLLSESLGLRPVVAAVVPVTRSAGDERLDEQHEEVRGALARSVGERLVGLEPEFVVLGGRSPARVLDALAREREARLIVVGSSHRGQIGRVLPGAVGESLLHGAPCAVAVAPLGFSSSGPAPILHIGVGVDGLAEADAALDTAIRLAQRFNARLTITAVAEPAPIGYGATLSVISAGEFEAYEVDEKRRVLDEAVARVPASLPVESRLRRGAAGRELAEATADVDLMVMGSRGYGPLRRTLLGSAAAKVIRCAQCAVIVLPRSAGPDPLGVTDGSVEPDTVGA